MQTSHLGAFAKRAAFLIAVLATSSVGSAQNYVRHRVLVKFADNASAANRQNSLDSVHGHVDAELPQIGVKVISLPESANEAAVLNGLAHRAGVQFAELDRIVGAASVTPNDPAYNYWQSELRQINAPVAWSYTTGSASVIVAVIGSGVDGTHEDLVSKMVPGWNFYNNNSDARDVVGHDTSVAGIIGASSNNGIGVASVAWGTRIMPLRVTDLNDYATYSNIAAAINYAADHGCKIANPNFWGTEMSSAITSAAHYMFTRGGVVVVPAGNTSSFLSTHDNPEVVMVSAVGAGNVIAPWSCTGNPIDVCSPSSGFATYRGGGYGPFSGTCAASATAAGAVALVMSANPLLTPTQVIDSLKSTALDLGPGGWDATYGTGLIDVGAAVQAAIGTGGPPPDWTPPTVSVIQPTDGQVLHGAFVVSAQASDNIGVTSLTVSIDGTLVASASSGQCSYTWNTLNATKGVHQIQAIAKDAAGNLSMSAVNVDVENTVDAVPPVVSIANPVSGAKIGSSLTVSANATDNVGVVKVELWVDGKLTLSDSASPWTFSVNTKKWRTGTHSLVCKAYDAAGNSATSSPVSVTK